MKVNNKHKLKISRREIGCEEKMQWLRTYGQRKNRATQER